MSIRLKVFLIISAIVFVISASSVAISTRAAQNQIIRTLEHDMQRVAAGANEFILDQIDMIKMDAAAVAQVLRGRTAYEQFMILPEQVAAWDFMAIAVYNAQGNIEVSYSLEAQPPPEQLARGEIGRLAFSGERVITTTHIDPSGQLVFYVFVPMDNYRLMTELGEMPSNPQIVGATFSGQFFNDQLIRFQAENAGRIIVLDSAGTLIADVYHIDWVENRLNFIELARYEPALQEKARVFHRMVTDNEDIHKNVDRYRVRGLAAMGEDIDDIVAFRTIPSAEGWVIAACAAVADSPFQRVWLMIGLSGLIFLGLGALAAALASGVIAKPFEIAEAMAKAKTAFIANMSHDLRTPLNAIVSLSQLSQTMKIAPIEVENHQKRIFESGMNIRGVINDLLDISNIESGKFGIISAEYDLPDFILDTVQSNMRHIGSHPVSFNVVPQSDLPATLNGDSLRVRQVFNNVLRNAITNTREGTVEWRFSTEKTGNTVWFVSTITDTSPGLSAEDIDKLFLDYSSLDTQKMRSSQGTGLGLSLTKKIVELMKGTITVQSTVGKGTVFTIRLPHTCTGKEPTATGLAERLNAIITAPKGKFGDVTAIERVKLSGIKVLVVDDVELDLDVTRGMLEPYGIQVDGVLSGQEAIDHIRKGEPRYNAIFMNRWMHEMDGIKTLQIIRDIDSDYAKNIPVVALVANALGNNNAFFMKSGFQSVLAKPINVLRLDSLVRQLLASEQG